MTKQNILCVGTAACLVLTMGAAGAASLEMGQRLTTQQLKGLQAQSVTVGKQQLKVVTAVSPKAASAVNPMTTVINELGAVGESRNEVVISQVKPAEVRSAVTQLKLATVSTSYYETTGVSTLRFASFDQAAWAHERLSSLLPNAVLAVPVRYTELKAR